MEFSEYVYEVRVHYGRDLPKMDVASPIDAYVRVAFPGGERCTRTLADTADPVWDSPADVLVGTAPAAWTLTVELWDRDRATADDHVADIALPRTALPVVRREYPVGPHGVLCLSASCFCAPACARARLAPPVTHVPAAGSSAGEDWHAPLPAAPMFALGLHYSLKGSPALYVAQTDPATLASAFARFVIVGDGNGDDNMGAVSDTGSNNKEIISQTTGTTTTTDLMEYAENTVSSHFLVGGASLLSVADPTRVDVLRRVGGPKGLRVFGEARLEAPGRVALARLAVRAARRRRLLATWRLADLARDAGWPRTTTCYADARAHVRGCVLDDAHERVYFCPDPRVAVSVTCAFAAARVAAHLVAGHPGLYLDLIHSTANARTVVEYPRPVPLAGGQLRAASQVTIADPPNVMHFDQVYIMLYEEEDVVDVPVLSVLPLC